MCDWFDKKSHLVKILTSDANEAMQSTDLTASRASSANNFPQTSFAAPLATECIGGPRPCVHRKYLADPPEGWLIERLAQVFRWEDTGASAKASFAFTDLQRRALSSLMGIPNSGDIQKSKEKHLEGSFSAVSKPSLASKYHCCSIFVIHKISARLHCYNRHVEVFAIVI